MSFLKKLFGGGSSSGASADKTGPATKYRGYRILPAPMQVGGQYQTAGFIEKDFEGGSKRYRFVRVDKHSSKEDAEALIVIKGQQIIDEQGDRIFDA
jgi:hypothetical protein